MGLLNPIFAIKIEGKNREEEGTTLVTKNLSRSWKAESRSVHSVRRSKKKKQLPTW